MIAIAAASFKEAVKKKIIHLTGLLTFIYLILFTLLIYLVTKDMKRTNTSTIMMFINISGIVSIIGFYFSSMLLAFLTIMASTGCISSEIESGIIHSVITKPLKRMEYVIGKYLGLALLLTAYSTFLYAFFLIIPILLNVSSTSSLGAVSLLKGLAFFVFEPLAILSLSLFGSVYFKTLNNGIFVATIYILGLIGGMMEQIGAAISSTALVKLGILSSLVSPFDSIYRYMQACMFTSIGMSSRLIGPVFLSDTVPSGWMMAYALIFSISLIILAVRKFNKKDIS